VPHSPDETKRAIGRLRRIKGQAEALERAVEAGVDCSALLQQIAALRGAANGLMSEVLESHLRETFDLVRGDGPRGGEEAGFAPEAELDGIIRMLRTYLK
jgi:FrmR/RcnR family transcriptional regulator, repressor of frmRAB operon